MKRLLLVAFALASFGAWQTAKAQTYCSPQIILLGCFSGHDLNSVSIGTFSDPNTGCGFGYDDRTSNHIYLTASTSASYTFTSTTTSTMQYGLWIDLNQDGDFGDPGEYILTGTTSQTGSFVVPGTAVAGTRMRLIGLHRV